MNSHNKHSHRRLTLVTEDYAPPGTDKKTLHADALSGKYGGDVLRTRHERRSRRQGLKRLVVAGGAIALTGLGVFAYNKAADTDKAEEPTVVLGSHVVTADDSAGKLKIAQDMIDESNGRITVSAEQLLPYMHTEHNPEAGTAQNPADRALQLGERVNLEVPESVAVQITGPPNTHP